MDEIMYTVVILVSIIITSYIANKICNIMDNDFEFEKTIEESKNIVSGIFTIEFRTIKKFISELFYNKNNFGKFIGVIITILSIPAIGCFTIGMIIILICKLGKIIYLLGDKK